MSQRLCAALGGSLPLEKLHVMELTLAPCDPGLGRVAHFRGGNVCCPTDTATGTDAGGSAALRAMHFQALAAVAAVFQAAAQGLERRQQVHMTCNHVRNV